MGFYSFRGLGFGVYGVLLLLLAMLGAGYSLCWFVAEVGVA